MSTKLFKILFFFQATLSYVHAGSISIVLESRLHLNKQPDGVYLTGTLSLMNKGNEIARDVFPVISINNWKLAFDKFDLDINQSKTWNVNNKVQSEDCSSECNLKNFGYYPVLVYSHYSDRNLYPFSALNVMGILYNPYNDPSITANSRKPSLLLKSEIEASGKDFDGVLIIKNPQSKNFQVKINIATSNELLILDSYKKITTIPSKSSQEIEFFGENASGLQGSSYAVFSIVQWSENNINKFSLASSLYKIDLNQSKKFSDLWLYLGIIFVFLTIATYTYGQKKKRKK